MQTIFPSGSHLALTSFRKKMVVSKFEQRTKRLIKLDSWLYYENRASEAHMFFQVDKCHCLPILLVHKCMAEARSGDIGKKSSHYQQMSALGDNAGIRHTPTHRVVAR